MLGNKVEVHADFVCVLNYIQVGGIKVGIGAFGLAVFLHVIEKSEFHNCPRIIICPYTERRYSFTKLHSP